jgi:hypothetical protein
VLAGCSRPPSRCDFPFQCNAQRHRHLQRGPRRSAADASRWAGGSRFVLFQFGFATLAASYSARDCMCQTHLTHVICARRPAVAVLPASAASSLASRMLRRRAAWRFAVERTARHGYHISVSVRAFAQPKSLPLMRADRRTPPLPPRPTPAAADRPLAAIFHHSVCRLSCCSTLASSSGGG